MSIDIPKINFRSNFAEKLPPLKNSFMTINESDDSTLPVYGDSPIRTKPAQLSLFHMHDFHGQNIRMERAYSAIKQFDDGTLINQNDIFDKNMPVDKLKLCSGDMFLGENMKESGVVNEFLNLSGIIASAIGNHECDTQIDDFAQIVKNRKYRLLGTNMHPNRSSSMNSILSDSFIVEVHGNRYGIIGLVPEDMDKHMKRPEDVEEFNISEMRDTVKDLKKDIERIKKEGVNKIIVLSHLGMTHDQYIARNVSDIDVILGGHTHHFVQDAIKGENFVNSPKGEPVLIMQVGRDGEYVGIPNVKFNELGQITDVQYNVLKTDDFARSIIAKSDFETILGEPEVVGEIEHAAAPPKDIYANENPHCNFILDSLRAELDTDIAIMNSANIRNRFYEGPIDTRDLKLISPFANKVVIIKASEKEIVDAIKKRLKITMDSPAHRPGLLQVSGLKYTFSPKTGELYSLVFVDKLDIEHSIDIENPRENKFYTIATDDYCATSKSGGLGLKHRVDHAIKKFDCDKDEIVADFLRKQKEPVRVFYDGRIQSVD